jgi:putative ABC transport system permease protein
MAGGCLQRPGYRARSHVTSYGSFWGAALAGTVLGLAGALGFTKVLDHLVSDFPGSDLLVIGGVAILLFSVAIIACWLPARGATKVNPIQALRSE